MTDQEIIKALTQRAEYEVGAGKRDLLAAAERIRVLGEECEAWRECPHEHFSKVWGQPQMSGGHRSPYRQKIIDAVAATDAARRGA